MLSKGCRIRMSKMSIELIYNKPSYTKNSLVLITGDIVVQKAKNK